MMVSKANVKNSIKFNSIELHYNVIEDNATNQINRNNYTNYDEKTDALKGIIENIIAQGDN